MERRPDGFYVIHLPRRADETPRSRSSGVRGFLSCTLFPLSAIPQYERSTNYFVLDIRLWVLLRPGI